MSAKTNKPFKYKRYANWLIAAGILALVLTILYGYFFDRYTKDMSEKKENHSFDYSLAELLCIMVLMP